MTPTLYRAVLIKSAEQAEEMPRGTYAHQHLTYWHADNLFSEENRYATKTGSLDWSTTSGYSNGEMLIGWTALVPIQDGQEPIKQLIADISSELRNKIWPGSLKEVVRDILTAYHRRLQAAAEGSPNKENR